MRGSPAVYVKRPIEARLFVCAPLAEALKALNLLDVDIEEGRE